MAATIATPRTTYKSFYQRSIAEPEAFWAEEAKRIDWHKPFAQGARLLAAAVRATGSSAARPISATTRSTGTSPRAATRRRWSGSRPRSTQSSTFTYRELHAEVNRCAAMLRALGVGQGRPRADLHADDSGGGVRDARLRAHRRDPLGGVRRLRRGEPGRAHRRRAAQGDGHRRRRHRARGKVVRLQAAARRGDPARQAPAADRCCWSTAGSTPHGARRRPRPRLARRCARSTPTRRCRARGSSRPSRRYILYTRGTTGKPKGVQRDTGGYAVALAASHGAHLLRRARRDVFLHLATSAGSWATPTSSTGRCIAGMTTIMYEGVPMRPDAGRLVEDRRRTTR